MAQACNPSTLGVRGRWIMRSGVQDQTAQYGKTLSLLKIQQLSRYGGARLWSQLLRWLRQENHLNPGGGGYSEPRSCHCTPAWVTRVRLSEITKPACHHKPTSLHANAFFSMSFPVHSIHLLNISHSDLVKNDIP